MIKFRINNGEWKEPDVISYPDGTLKIDIPCSDVASFSFLWKFRDEKEFLTIAYMNGNLRERFPAASSELIMPYLPNARMDRVHSSSEVFTLKYFCGLINSLGFSRVYVLDVHSNVGAALLDRCTNLSPEPYITSARKLCGFDPEKDYVFFPDEGSCKRYTHLFTDCRHIGFGIKKRSWSDGKILGLDIAGELPRGRNVFIVDDICAFGGTVFHSAKKLRELGCGDINVFFTHCEDSIAKGELLKGELITRIFTTDSLCTLDPTEKITILPVIS